MDAKDAVPHAARRERRWWRYSLRSLFLLTTVLAAACSWFAVESPIGRRDSATRWQRLTELGGFVCYDYQLDSRSPVPPWHPREPLGCRSIGRRFLCRVVSVTLGCDRELGYLGNLPRLKSLRIDDSGSPEFAITGGIKSDWWRHSGGRTGNRSRRVRRQRPGADFQARESSVPLCMLSNMRGGWLRYVERLGAVRPSKCTTAARRTLTSKVSPAFVNWRWSRFECQGTGPGLASLGAPATQDPRSFRMPDR